MARIELLDFLRGVALLAMTVFHFAFDLQLFGFREPGFIDQPHWKYFARGIASSFLFLVGFSLYLAHCQGVKWASWRWRMTKIMAAALVITIATYFATPAQYIFFGILHQIAFASLAGLLFLKLPVVFTLLCAVAVFWAGQTVELAALNHPFWWWTGLSETRPMSSDYVPVFPWWSASIAGVAVAKLCSEFGALPNLALPKLDQAPSRLLKFIGRHSLAYYLVHQPVMIGGFLLFMLATGRVSL
ncbi:MAG: heparan-alpha-glucosaminide N-acetyltransferase [Pseudomonadota bacterium]